MFSATTRTIGTAAALAVGLLALPAQAISLAPGEFRSAVSTFGLNDQGTSTGACALCDSVVNTGVYRSSGGNWVSELGLGPVINTLGSGGIDFSANYAFFYQFQNTNPLGGTNAPLENFNVTSGVEGTPRQYTSGGFLTGQTFENFINSDTPLDIPHNGAFENGNSPGGLVSTTGPQERPAALAFSDEGPSPIASSAVKGGLVAYEGALFSWDINEFDGLVDPGAFSTVLWLTSDHAPTLVWAETESQGGFGAAGDVYGAASAVPLPAGILLLGPALLALGYAGRRREAV